MNFFQKIFFMSLLLFSLTASATHNRSGEITYRHIQGYTYEFTITTCTKTSSEADRNELEVFWGDGTRDTIPRVDTEFFTNFDAQKNIYRFEHTYAGPSVYTISMEDPNRNGGVLNISSSIDKPFCIQTQLVISPFIGGSNNSLILEDCPCPEYACANQKWCYNTSAYDPDGDSLSYELIPCKGEGCLSMDIPGVYQYPHDLAGGTLIIDPVSGTLCWENPEFVGEYNIAIKISEYRQGVFIGSVIRDMQITVQVCNNDAPKIDIVNDICVDANENIFELFQATDVNNDLIVFSATGSIFNNATNPASFTANNGTGIASGSFVWTPNCDDVRNDPYDVVLTAEDNSSPVQLKDIVVWRIKVRTPPVDNLVVQPLGNTMQLTWDAINCVNVEKYNIYRATDSIVPGNSCCEAGAALTLGYELIGDTDELTTTFVDNSSLSVGINYCYVVTAVLENGAESCPVNVDCGELDFEVPIMTRVTIISTDVNNGQDSVMWSSPKELDELIFPGPYEYRLYHRDGFENADVLIYTSPTDPTLSNIDSVFVHTLNNTEDTAHNYFVELYSNASLVGNSITASSPYLQAASDDNQAILSWNYQVPWLVDSTFIFRESFNGSGIFNFVGVSYTNNYIDTGLVNNQTYCYKIKTIGKYDVSGVPDPLENWSQETCVVPFDYTAPCAPIAEADLNCNLEEITLSWNNPNNSCADDVIGYNIYFAESEGETPTLWFSIDDPNDTTITLQGDSIAPGCYYITALDSLIYGNESDFSKEICVSHCDPLYVLPNVFTPNGDNSNDVYHPVLPYRNVDRVDFMVKNRWGNPVFSTEDPMLNWDGVDPESGKMLSEGVYFYYCKVYFQTLTGEESLEFTGFITLKNPK